MGRATEANGEDPFLAPRDDGEERISAVMQEFLLRERTHERMYRQGGVEDGYALVVPRLTGEAVLSIPALYEADFIRHGNPGTGTEELARFIVECLDDSGADHLRIPLLTEEQASRLVEALGKRLPDWRVGRGLASVIPWMKPDDHGRRVGRSLRRALARALTQGVTVEFGQTFPIAEVVRLHELRWGPNRGESHFRMLEELTTRGCAELGTARSETGELIAVRLVLLGRNTRHAYYAVSNTGRMSGVGTALRGAEWQRFVEDAGVRWYSFGRGAERYKYQYANAVQERYEVRGFYAPAPDF